MTLNNENNNECCKCTTPEITIELNQQGPQGRQGNPGKDGFSPSITVNTSSDDAYILQIETKDGTILTPNLKAAFPPDGEANSILVNDGTNHPFWTGNINNLITTDTTQTITGNKQFSGDSLQVLMNNGDSSYLVAIKGADEDIANNYNNSSTILNYVKFPSQCVFSSGIVKIVQAAIPDLNIPAKYANILDSTMIKPGDGIYIERGDNESLTINSSIEQYTLPPATTTTLGGIKVGENLTITEDGTLNATGGGSLPDNVAYTNQTNSFTEKQNFNGINVSGYASSNYIAGLSCPTFEGNQINLNLTNGKVNWVEDETNRYSLQPGIASGQDNTTLYLEHYGATNKLITDGNISQDAYIQQLEARIAALEALIDGGNATND